MGHKKKELVDLAVLAIKSNRLVFFDEIAEFMPVGRSALYKRAIHKVDEVKEALIENKLKAKRALRAKWYNSDQPTTQIALYKLMADEEELEKLSPRKAKVELSQDPDGAPLIPDHVAKMIDRAYVDPDTNETPTD